MLEAYPIMAMDFQKEQRTFRYVVEHANILFFSLTIDGQIIEMNAYAESMVGHDLYGKHFRELIVDFSGSFALRRSTRETSQAQLLTIKTVSGLPQSYYFHFRLMEQKLLVYGCLDGQELELMRKEMLSLNQELNNLTRQLHKQNATLRRLNREKNQFLGMAAHDLRKPIGLILSYSEFLLEEAAPLLDGEHTEFLDTIISSCAYMQKIVDDFLDISIIEAGKFELDLQPDSIHEILARSLVLNNVQAKKKGINLRVEGDAAIPHLLMDAPKIEQALTNLITNAIDHSHPKSSVTVTLIDDLDGVTCSIKDTGAGMKPEDVKTLFKPFAKTSTKKTAQEKSTGLGLLITRKIIEAHNGRIWVESREGEGTCVYFSLPSDSIKPHVP